MEIGIHVLLEAQIGEHCSIDVFLMSLESNNGEIDSSGNDTVLRTLFGDVIER